MNPKNAMDVRLDASSMDLQKNIFYTESVKVK